MAMADNSEDENILINNHHLPELDSVSEQTSRSESSIISIISTIRISEKDQIRFDGMIGYSDESDDSNLDPAKLINSTYDKQYPHKNEGHTQVKPLCSVVKAADALAVSDLSISGLSSFLNISGLSENLPFSTDFGQQLFQDKIQDEQKSTDEKYSTDNDFSPSDGSDFNPEKAGFNSDDSCEQVTEDEFYDDQIVVQNNTRNEKNVVSPKSKKTHEERNKKARYQRFPTDEEKYTTNEEIGSVRENIESKEKIHDKGTGQSLGKRTWNRRNACFYCQEVVTNFSRHLLRHHANEIEVLKYRSINDKDLKIRKLKRQAITNRLRNQGNFIHNSKVSFDRDGESTILPSKRNNQGTSSPSCYATCKVCLGTFKRTTFFRHMKNCNSSNDENKLPSLKKKALYNHSITIISNTINASDELRDNILSHLRSDKISLVIKNDPLIIAYGSRLLKKKKERRSRKQICSKMRDLATLLNFIRKKDSTIETLTDVIDPEKYDTFIDAIKAMSGFDEKTGTVNITSIPARMRPSILGCIDILYTQCIMSTESTAYKEAYKKKLDDFKRLIEINWQWEISSNAEKSRKKVNMTKESVIPLDEDIAIVMRKIQKIEIKYSEKLRMNRDIINYESLCIITIAHIIMLDRKRAGDVAQAELSYFINRKNEDIPEKVLETLTPVQRKSIKDLDIFQIPGKRTRSVPILLTKTMRENIDLIIACREDLNIPSSNKYLFARPGTEEPFDGGKCLDKIKKQCNLKRPEMLTSTGMRHHIATMSQIHAKQNDQYTEHLAGFLGHDIEVHKKNYRLPMQVLQKAVVGTQLIEYENTSTKKRLNETETRINLDVFMNKQDENIKKLKMPYDSRPPDSLTLNIDRTYKTLEEVNEEPETKINKEESLNDPRTKTIQTKVKPNIRKICNSESDEEKPIKKIYKTRHTKGANERRKVDVKQSSGSSISESDEEKPVQKRNKNNHRKWSEEEIKTVKKHFQTYINKKINPGKSKCTDILNKEPVLRNRTWMQLNTYVNNIYKKK